MCPAFIPPSFLVPRIIHPVNMYSAYYVPSPMLATGDTQVCLRSLPRKVPWLRPNVPFTTQFKNPLFSPLFHSLELHEGRDWEVYGKLRYFLKISVAMFDKSLLINMLIPCTYAHR